jgi:hypothetical protein
MLIIYEVVVARGEDPEAVLSSETLAETQAQVMTLEQARAVGFSHGRPHVEGLEVRLVAVAARDAQFVQRRLEGSHVVQSFKAHEVG